jgi:hypothetical protein
MAEGHDEQEDHSGRPEQVRELQAAHHARHGQGAAPYGTAQVAAGNAMASAMEIAHT